MTSVDTVSVEEVRVCLCVRVWRESHLRGVAVAVGGGRFVF